MIVASAVSHWRVEGDGGGRQRWRTGGRRGTWCEQVRKWSKLGKWRRGVTKGCKNGVQEGKGGRKEREATPTHFFTITKKLSSCKSRLYYLVLDCSNVIILVCVRPHFLKRCVLSALDPLLVMFRQIPPEFVEVVRFRLWSLSSFDEEESNEGRGREGECHRGISPLHPLPP